jgi:electron transfer flavoprotein beta subunit
MKAPRIVVCIKDVPDPEGPKSAFHIESDAKRMVPIGIPPVINPYDENALELALCLKEQWGGTILVVNVSEKATVPVLKKALSVGADELLLLEDPSFRDLTGPSIAAVLAAGINKTGPFDLVLTGRESADWEGGQVGLFLAEILSIPAINLVKSAELEEGAVLAQKLKRLGYEVVKSPLPALLTVSSEAGELRLPTLKAIQEVRKKPSRVLRAADMGIDASSLTRRNLYSLSAPPNRSRNCLFIGGETARDRGWNLGVKLREDGVI